MARFAALGYPCEITRKNGVFVQLGGKDKANGLLLEVHMDTLGGMVAQIKGNGRLRLTPLGGMNANNAEAENVWVYTRSGKVIDGTMQLCNASVHVNGDYSSAKRSFDTMEVVLDEDVKCAADTRKLGVEVGTYTHIAGSLHLYQRSLDEWESKLPQAPCKCPDPLK